MLKHDKRNDYNCFKEITIKGFHMHTLKMLRKLNIFWILRISTDKQLLMKILFDKSCFIYSKRQIKSRIEKHDTFHTQVRNV